MRKMKNRISAIVVLVIVVVLAAIGIYTRNQTTNHNAATSSSSIKTSGSVAKKKETAKTKAPEPTLIVYYSNSGTTQGAAENIQKKTGADIVEMQITPAYPSDYSTLTQVAKKQINDNARPKITNLPDLTKYRTILLGFPTWYHRPPMFINTFFEQANVKGKTIIPFTTSASSPMSESTPFLEKMAQGTGAALKEGFRANDDQATTRYLEQAGLLKN
ncbi:flavodoxin [Schleiferilactobacillus perolens DSM 12744]|uniref:Flavodoxin n=2 Tax=Schleiferilactobacillus perolens TaxID=100468 RepID=A0A0R1MYW4_9LACO|nr:flavodoxin [Schleiferilactobacillus perolens DSM 12744]